MSVPHQPPHPGDPQYGRQHYGQQHHGGQHYGGPPLRGPHPEAAYREGSAAYWHASQDERTVSLLTHLGALLVSAVVPLIVFLLKKDDSPFLREQSRQSLNLQITLIIAAAVSSLLMVVLIGFVLLPLVVLAGWVLQIIAAYRASQGEVFRMPFVLDLVK